MLYGHKRRREEKLVTNTEKIMVKPRIEEDFRRVTVNNDRRGPTY